MLGATFTTLLFMKNKISKGNALIEASYTLDVVQQRLVLLAIIEAREQKTLLEARGLLRINAESYMKHFNVNRSAAYESLKAGAERLFNQFFSYQKIDEASGKVGFYKSRWVDKAGYVDGLGCVELVFASDVISLITRLEERYTEYEIKIISALQSAYAIRLYELLIQWRAVGKMPDISLEDFRKKLGVLPNEYQTMWNFKSRVLDKAVQQINKNTDITVEYEQLKDGRNITGFAFSFTPNSNSVKKSIDKIIPAKNKAKKVGVASKAAKNKSSDSASNEEPKYTWDTPENSTLKLLQVKCPELNKENVETASRFAKVGIYDFLSQILINMSKVQTFSLVEAGIDVK